MVELDKIPAKLTKALAVTLKVELELEVEGLKDFILELYAKEFEDFAGDYEGLAHPSNFKPYFEEKLDAYEFIRLEGGDNMPALYLPTIETFDFGEELSVLRYMMEGFVGTLYELPEVDVKNLLALGNLPQSVEDSVFSLEPMFGAGTEEYLRFRLVPEGPAIDIIEDILGRKLSVFPFSEVGTVDFFESINDYVIKHRPDWETKAITKAIERLK